MPSLPLVMRSPAKINLFLKITGKRPDGYHNIATLFQMIDLCDVMTFRPWPRGGIRVTCSDRSIPAKKNLAYLAAKMLWRSGLPGVWINIEKNIPSGAGLGGGSSNAAAALYWLNRIWGLGRSEKALRARAKKLGADVPFFLFGPRAWATGVGDRLKAVPVFEKFYVLLVKPRVKISTKNIYAEFDRELTSSVQSVRIPARVDRCFITLDGMGGLLANDLVKVVEKKYPIIKEIKKRLEKFDCKGVMLSGSGSAVFAIFKKRREVRKAFENIKNGSWWCATAKAVDSMNHMKCQGG